MALQQPMLNDKWLETPICLNILISLIIAIHVILIEVHIYHYDAMTVTDGFHLKLPVMWSFGVLLAWTRC